MCMNTAIYRLDEANKLSGDSRDLIDRQNQQLSDQEAELGLLRRRLESVDADRERDKKQIALLQDALNRTRAVSRAKLIPCVEITRQSCDYTAHKYDRYGGCLDHRCELDDGNDEIIHNNEYDRVENQKTPVHQDNARNKTCVFLAPRQSCISRL